MPSPDLSPTRPPLQHAITSPPRRQIQLLSPSSHASSSTNPFFAPDGFDPGRRGSLRKRPRRGLTFEEVQSCGVIDDEEKSSDFEGLPISPEEIKGLPRKLREYYEHLAQLKEHYNEVDGLLSGELPSTIANSFQPPSKSYSHLQDEADEGPDVNKMPGWMRRGSAWKVPGKKVGDHRENGNGKGDPEAGERTGLLSSEEREEKRDKLAKLALNVNTVVNVILVAAKAVAVLYSSSISLTASLVDSVLDLLSTFIILGTSWAIGMKSDRHLYPAGKRRFEPLGVLVFSVAMIASFIQVFIESFQRATRPSSGEVVDLSRVGVLTMLATIGVKLVLWFWCAHIRSSGVQALAQDAENDVYFNIMSLAFPFVGSKLHLRLLDPIGGMVLSLYIIFEWLKTLAGNFANLSGKSAPRDQITRVLYLVTRFNPVLEISDVECYHMGDDLIVEIDVILPQSSTLHFAHDVGETIQCVLESLDGVLRAYVHCDYSSSNPLQHTSRNPAPSTQYSSNATKGSRKPASNDSSGSVTPTNKNTVAKSFGQDEEANVKALPGDSDEAKRLENGHETLSVGET